MTAVGFEPTPFRNGALSHRLRPLGQTVMFRLRLGSRTQIPNNARDRSPAEQQTQPIRTQPLAAVPPCAPHAMTRTCSTCVRAAAARPTSLTYHRQLKSVDRLGVVFLIHTSAHHLPESLPTAAFPVHILPPSHISPLRVGLAILHAF